MGDTDASGAIWIAERSCRSPDDAVHGNWQVVAALLAGELLPEELTPVGLRCFCVAHYALNEGRLADVVAGAQWDARFLGHLRAGLADLGCVAHLAALDRAARVVDGLRGPWLDAFLDYDGIDDGGPPNERKRMARSVRQSLDGASAALRSAHRAEPARRRAGEALLAHPRLIPLGATALRERVAAAVAAVPLAERERRAAQAFLARCKRIRSFFGEYYGDPQ